MNCDSNRIIVIDDPCNLCDHAVDVYHQNLPEMRIRGPSAGHAAEELADQLESSLEVVSPFHREPVRLAIADVRAFLVREDTAAQFRNVPHNPSDGDPVSCTKLGGVEMGQYETENARHEVAPQEADSHQPGEPQSCERRAALDHGPGRTDQVDTASMDSFPCSDAPGYYPIRC